MATHGICVVVLCHRANVHPRSFLVAAMGIGSCITVPLHIWKMAQGAVIRGGFSSYMAMTYTAVFPSFIAYLYLNRGVELIGAGRAGQSIDLMPLFGSILAVMFLRERLQIYHVRGISLIAAGILLASLHPFRRVPPAVRAS